MWILIVVTSFIIGSGTGKTVAFQEFENSQTCRVAATQISGAGIKTFCVQK